MPSLAVRALAVDDDVPAFAPRLSPRETRTREHTLSLVTAAPAARNLGESAEEDTGKSEEPVESPHQWFAPSSADARARVRFVFVLPLASCT